MTGLSIGATTASYAYNGDGLRMSSTVGSNTVDYIWDVAAGLPVVLQDGTNTYVYGLGLISTYDGTDMTYRLTDGLGSTVNLCDASGNVLVTYAYDAFGGIRSQTGSSNNYWQFTGEQRDSESGFDYLRARYYDPETGRFLGQDPLGGGYAYALNNPANFVDASGKLPERVDACTDWREGVCTGKTSIAADFATSYYLVVDIPKEDPSDLPTRIVYSGASGEVLQTIEYTSNPGWHVCKDCYWYSISSRGYFSLTLYENQNPILTYTARLTESVAFIEERVRGRYLSEARNLQQNLGRQTM
jgi:RHS repeat-associated protein